MGCNIGYWNLRVSLSVCVIINVLILTAWYFGGKKYLVPSLVSCTFLQCYMLSRTDFFAEIW